MGQKLSGVLGSARYLPYILFHPFDGFYEMKFRGRGSPVLSTVLLFLYGVLRIADLQYSGYIINHMPKFAIDPVNIFLSSVIPFMVFILSNWSTTTLMNGTGRFTDIYNVICYALTPVVIARLAAILVSNVIIAEEAAIISAITAIGSICFVFLAFCGLCVIHEYGFLKNIVTLLATVVAAVIIVFIAVLYFTLLDKVRIFIETISGEIMRRF